MKPEVTQDIHAYIEIFLSVYNKQTVSSYQEDISISNPKSVFQDEKGCTFTYVGYVAMVPDPCKIEPSEQCKDQRTDR